MGSKSRVVPETERSLEIPSVVTNVKDEKLGVMKGGGIRGEVRA
jgi:hypothetical protein